MWGYLRGRAGPGMTSAQMKVPEPLGPHPTQVRGVCLGMRKLPIELTHCLLVSPGRGWDWVYKQMAVLVRTCHFGKTGFTERTDMLAVPPLNY